MLTKSPHVRPLSYRVQKAISLIQEAGSGPISLSRIASEVNISSSRLRHLFKSEVGLSPGQYIKRLRMNVAKQLAATTFLSVKEIVYKVGVADQSHFLRDFKRRFGVTITQYRHRCFSQNGQ